MTDGSLTKAALVEQVAHVAGLTKKCAEIIVDTVFGNIVAALPVELLRRRHTFGIVGAALRRGGAAAGRCRAGSLAAAPRKQAAATAIAALLEARPPSWSSAR